MDVEEKFTSLKNSSGVRHVDHNLSEFEIPIGIEI